MTHIIVHFVFGSQKSNVAARNPFERVASSALGRLEGGREMRSGLFFDFGCHVIILFQMPNEQRIIVFRINNITCSVKSQKYGQDSAPSNPKISAKLKSLN